MTDYGAEFAVNGVRPRFVRDGDWIRAVVTVCGSGYIEGVASTFVGWSGCSSILLKSDHPQYLVAQHPGMVMHITDARPVDFDASKQVLLRAGSVIAGSDIDRWNNRGSVFDLIGYHPLPSSPSVEHQRNANSERLADYECIDIPSFKQSEAGIPVTDGDIPQWAVDRAAEIRDADFDNSTLFFSFARYIAAHEAPPVDEATELWATMCEVITASCSLDASDIAAIQVIRAHLAKVRTTASQSLTASNIAPNGRTASPRGQDG